MEDTAAKQVARRMYGAMHAHDLEGFAAQLAEDVANHGTSSQGREQSRRELGYWLSAFPDLEIAIERMVCEGDTVAARYIGRGTHQGALGAIPATGKEIAVVQVDILRVAGEQVIEGWYLPDLFGLMRQLGAIGDVLGDPEAAAIDARA